ncbi:MAG: 2OG-Fe(II) oxygenase [Bryobacterales bacterium]
MRKLALEDMSAAVREVLGVDRLQLQPKPFPHLVLDGFFEPGLYEQLRTEFPQITKMKRPKGWGQSLYWGDAEYDAHLAASPAWKKVHDMVHSQEWIEYIIQQFGDYWRSEGCTVDLAKAVYVPYCEDRIDKELLELRRPAHPPHELWSRLDFYQSYSGYYRPVHLDHRRRLISMLVYFQDKDEVGMEGGELILHPPSFDLAMLERLRLYHAPKPFSKLRDRLAQTIAVKPKHNRMAVFPCGKHSWHSVPAVRSEIAPRQHIQITISSSYDAWN